MKKGCSSVENYAKERRRVQQASDRMKRANPSLPIRVSMKETTIMNRSSSGIGGLLDGIKTQISILDKEIRDDQKGKKDYEDNLQKLYIRKNDITKRLQASNDWLAHFDKDIGPFERKYATMTDQMSGRYDIAKSEHAKGLQVLMDEFQYHPQYKRYNDQFTAVPFRPK